MKKKVLLSMALLSAIVTVGSTPLTSYASQTSTTKVLTKNGYTIIMGQGVDTLNQTFKELETTLGNGGKFCWNTDTAEGEKTESVEEAKEVKVV